MSRWRIDEILDRGVLLFDGAMGTYYAALSDTPLERCELGNRTRPELVGRIHREYVEAGCRAIKTNTFGCGAIAAEQGLDEAGELAELAWHLAAEAVRGQDVPVFADFGPPAVNREASAEKLYRGLADRFLSLGATQFLFETFRGDWLVRETAAYIRKKCPEAYIIASFAVTPDGFTGEGLPGAGLVRDLLRDGLADAAGFNCVSGPGHLARVAASVDGPDSTLSVMPNAGYPTVVGGRTVYNSSPGYFAQALRDMAETGVKILGGCCGTDPAYIRAAADLLYGGGAVVKVREAEPSPPRERAAEQGRNRFREKLMSGRRVIAVELDSPLDSDITRYMDGARSLQAAGADVITIADCPVARSRMDSSIVACKLRRELDMEAMPHMTCRDRNLNATKALLLGLSMEGVHSVLVVTGDPVPTTERESVKSVYNFNSRMLARYVRQLGEEVFRTPFLIGGALNVNAVNFDVQLRLAGEKVKNGVELFLTQPVMTDRGAENLRRARDTLDAKILGGIMPVVSYRNACFIRSELAGMDIDDETVERYRDLSKEECARLGVDLSLEIAEKIRGDIDGYYLITPFNRTDMITEIIRGIGEM